MAVAQPAAASSPAGRGVVRGYIDGCFDLMHAGHYNAIRQAKQLCDVLVVGVHSDAEIDRNKGPPVMREAERYALLDHIKWIDEILYDVPYSPSLETLALASADFCVHGDDLPKNSEGVGAYDALQEAGKLVIVKRTEGVSTTCLIERLLLLTSVEVEKHASLALGAGESWKSLLPTTHRISEFSNKRAPGDGDVVIYLAGDFDLFNIAHARVFEAAKKLGTFLLVGVHGDERPPSDLQPRPVMNMLERVLNVCACKHVDDVIIGAPHVVSEDLLVTLKVAKVVICTPPGESTPRSWYAVPERLGLLHQMEPPMASITTADLAERVKADRLRFEARNSVRVPREEEYHRGKVGSQEGLSEI